MTQHKRFPTLTLTHPDTAGIDIGSANHFVAVPAERDNQPVREFRSFTADLRALDNWPRQCEVHTMAMESTGLYLDQQYEEGRYRQRLLFHLQKRAAQLGLTLVPQAAPST